MSIKTEILVRGVKTVEMVTAGIRQTPWEDYEALSVEDQTKIDALFVRYADGHRIQKENFKKVEGTDGIYEFKKHQQRWLGFTLPGHRFIVAAFELKKKHKLKPGTIERAEDVRAAMKGVRARN